MAGPLAFSKVAAINAGVSVLVVECNPMELANRLVVVLVPVRIQATMQSRAPPFVSHYELPSPSMNFSPELSS